MMEKIKQIIHTVSLTSQQMKHKTKNWKFQFHIGRTVTRFHKKYESCEPNMWNTNLQVNMCDVLHRSIPQWEKICTTLPMI